jgi:hypothetical protein
MASNLQLQNLISLLQSILLISELSTATVVTALLHAKPESRVHTTPAVQLEIFHTTASKSYTALSF